MPKLSEQGIIANAMVVLVLLAGIGVGIYLVTHPTIFRSKASSTGTRVEIVDVSGTPITSTTIPNVKLKLTYVAPSPSPSPTNNIYTIASGYSATQGTNSWYYYYKNRGSNTASEATYGTAQMQAQSWHGEPDNVYWHAGDNKWMWVDADKNTAGDNEAVVIYWKAPQAGSAYITVTERRLEESGTGNGFVTGIGYVSSLGSMPNGFITQVNVLSTDSTQKTLTANRAMSGGDYLIYVKDSNGRVNGDASEYSISINFTPGSTGGHPGSGLPTLPPISGSGEVKTMVIQYIPPGGVRSLFPNAETPDPTRFTKNTLLPAMNSGTKQAINFTLADEDIHTINSPPPWITDNTLGAPPKADNQAGYQDMATIFSTQNICNIAKQKDIRMVVIWNSGDGEYGPKGFEDYITGSRGIPTNGPSLRGSEYCDDKTIYIANLNYTRGLAEALESFGHHLEGVFRYFRSTEYATWADDGSPRNVGLWGRGDSCGNDHNPPNARNEYDRSNTAAFQSDCRNWKADGTGAKESLNCNAWGCNGAGWLVWWMQNMPSSWWSYVADPDGSVLGIEAYAQTASFPTHFKVANSPAFLNGAEEQVFNMNGKIIDWTLTEDGGQKTIYAQFKVDGTWGETLSASIDYIPPTPTPEASVPVITPTARFILSAPSSVASGQEVQVRLSAQLDSDAANLFSGKLRFPADKLEVVRIDKAGSFIGSWTEDVSENSSGTISLIGGVVDPGYQTSGSPSVMATIVFRAKQPGSAVIEIDSTSQIFRNSDNAHILSLTDSTGANISITRPVPIPTTPTPSPKVTPTPSSTPQPVACKITSAVWNSSSNIVTEGSIVNLKVEAEGSCDGQKVSFEVKKDNGLLPSSSVGNNPSQGTFINNTASSSWVAEYTQNGPFGFLDPPKYYFNVSLQNQEVVKSQEPTLGVQKAKTFVKGDGNEDGSISLDDLSVLLSHYNKTQDFPREVDINDDSVVNTIDYSSALEIFRQSGVLKR